LIKRANPNVDFENTFTYDIVLNFGDGSDGDHKLSIIINGWEVRDQENNLYD